MYKQSSNRFQLLLWTGNLKTKIFKKGDFANRVENILSPNSDVTAGYNFNTPSVDSDYLLTTNITLW